jgi:hypothetical protein
MSSPPPHKFWASADDWRPEFVILGANVEAIPTAPPLPPVIIGVDGFWGAHEWTVYPQPHHPQFPYLAWIPLRSSNAAVPSNVLTQSVYKSMWRAQPDHPKYHVIDSALLDKLRHEWMSIKAAVQDPFHIISSDPSFSSVIADWDGFERWDWGQFSNVKNMGINKLLGPDFFKFTVRLLAFFIQSFVRRLGYYTSALLHPPTLAGHTCIGHRKRFGNGLINFPFPVVDSYV